MESRFSGQSRRPAPTKWRCACPFGGTVHSRGWARGTAANRRGNCGWGILMAYTVQSGDNLSKIARQYGMDVRDLIASNPQLANPNLIRPGQRINIPDEPVSPAARAAAGNVLAAAPSVAQVVRTAAQTAPTVVAPRVAPAISPTGLAIYQASERGISAVPTAARAAVPLPQGQGRTLLPTARTTPTVPLGQAFPRAGAALTPRGTVAAGQAALMTPRAAQVGTRQPAPAGSRGMGPGPQPQVIGARPRAPLIDRK